MPYKELMGFNTWLYTHFHLKALLIVNHFKLFPNLITFNATNNASFSIPEILSKLTNHWEFIMFLIQRKKQIYLFFFWQDDVHITRPQNYYSPLLEHRLFTFSIFRRWWHISGSNSGRNIDAHHGNTTRLIFYLGHVANENFYLRIRFNKANTNLFRICKQKLIPNPYINTNRSLWKEYFNVSNKLTFSNSGSVSSLSSAVWFILYSFVISLPGFFDRFHNSFKNYIPSCLKCVVLFFIIS